LSKKSSCDLCINGLKNCSQVTKSESELVNLKSEGFLSNPNENVFKILQVCVFTKHASIVFENTYEFFLISTMLKFPCTDHKKQMMADIFSYYIIMQMSQYTYTENQKTQKLNRTKKKIAKLKTNSNLGRYYIILF